ncbi:MULTISPECIES: DNA repair protein RecN [unclassified Lentimicrobium]|uniref:DNA repair protein RecN n=1 Tax=unclassified Lentimicrobium TaxID=2677434 RepID=UPI001556E78D|nr:MULTISPECIES: DNA repair protein RecN [unclassified Lentimicrobium]NPD45222.1 DNA repair protein RecN [Lentimicrobium sp. S6]NPD85401.1 DNA repair protein RecN [Lentimicrobium sp. L6]
MLQQLSIKNYVLIENQIIDFQSGFSVITGETGAGKSIIIGALGLLLGDRADKEVVIDKELKCIVEGSFGIEALNLKAFFEAFDLDYEANCIVRREVSKTGKSRAFVNDTPVNLQVLKALGIRLMDIHSQNQNQQLNQAEFRMNIVDAYADHDKQLFQYQSLFSTYKNGIEELELLKENYQKQINEQEYHQFLFDEIEKAEVHKGEQKEIEEELQVLSHAEDIKLALFQASSHITGEDNSIVEQLESILAQLQRVSSFQTDIALLDERLNSCIIELKDLGNEASVLEDQFQYDPVRMQYLNDKLESYLSLCRKHRLNNADELVEFKEELSSKIFSVQNLDAKIQELEFSLTKQLDELKNRAFKIRGTRINAAKKIEELVKKQLKELGLEKAELKIEVNDLGELAKNGSDQIQFLFKANAGSRFSDMTKVASGGEMSRLMLSFKYVLALKKALPSIVFDEIDTGVSGEVADKLAKLMMGLGEKLQVISISHLPQIAAQANHHYLVYKENDSIFTRSKIKKLNQQERLEEIAAMLSGSKVGDSAIKHAKELLGTKS